MALQPTSRTALGRAEPKSATLELDPLRLRARNGRARRIDCFLSWLNI
jgi:hypothetical protein